jgi:hypothetical protein
LFQERNTGAGAVGEAMSSRGPIGASERGRQVLISGPALAVSGVCLVCLSYASNSEDRGAITSPAMIQTPKQPQAR